MTERICVDDTKHAVKLGTHQGNRLPMGDQLYEVKG